MPHLTENAKENITKKQVKQRKYYNRGAKELGQLREGDRVKLQPVILGQKKWIDGYVKKKVRPRSYEVEAGGRIYIRNRRFLRRCEPAREEELEIETPPPPPETTEEPQVSIEPESAAPPGDEHVDRELTQESGYRTRSGRLSTRPARFSP